MNKLILLLLISFSISWLKPVSIKLNTETAMKPVQEISGSSAILPIRNANLVATDAVGRRLPTASETGPFRKNKYVGIFYFLWQGAYPSKTIYDITKLTRDNPTNPAYGPKGAFHWWGEPEAGYFKADDPWVIRRNLQLLTLAGVDILFFDASNGDPYLSTVSKLCKISLSMRQQGIPTPYICFVTNSKGAETVSNLYKNLYAPNRYADLWFRWQGKPLMLGKQEETIDPAQRNFFTWRYCWQFTDAKTQPGHWQWLDTTPQDYGWVDNPGKPEEIPVAVASHPVFGVGKSNATGRKLTLNRYKVSPLTDEGLHFAEQWKRALAVDPSVVFVTGWNEWIAQRFVADSNDHSMAFKNFIDHKMRQGETFFQDLYNEEFNRDIEPMKGGYTDSYYYQLVANIRRFKGMDAPEPSSPARTIPIDGQFTEWVSVKPSYNDPRGDVLHRNFPNFTSTARYVNNTGRNDITDSRVTYDAKNLYIYAKTNRPLTPSTGRNWMLLFIDADQSAKTGWQGYDYVVNRAISGKQTSISRWNGKTYQPTATGQLIYKNNELEISLPLKAIGQRSDRVRVDFHWADNIQKLASINEFFTNGDSAPDRRFNYRFTSK